MLLVTFIESQFIVILVAAQRKITIFRQK